MSAFFVSFWLVALAELGDKTQILALILASRFRRPVPIMAGILVASLLNHLLAGIVGVTIGFAIEGAWMRWAIALSFFAIAIWALFPDSLDGEMKAPPRMGVFGATVCAFFLAEIGDRTQIVTIALAARYEMLVPVVLGTTLGLFAANVPAVLLGRQFSGRLPLTAMRIVTSVVCAGLGIFTLLR